MGAAHARAGLPNQDAFCSWPPSGDGEAVVIAVSDGHGSGRSFRSQIGAWLAVQIATKRIRHFLRSPTESISLSLVKEAIEDRLTKELVVGWNAAVKRHLDRNPIPTEKLEHIAKESGQSACDSLKSNPVLAYGATLLCIVLHEAFIGYLQLGDGDILTVSENGEVTRPLPRDERLFANETTSLSNKEAWNQFRTGFQPAGGNSPALIMLATDGYANSFRDDQGFLKVGSDILDMIRTDGIEKVKQEMGTWLREASSAGSGDDITLGIVTRVQGGVATGSSEWVPKS